MDFQDRINRMNAEKAQKKRADEEFIRKQNIRLFINNCDEIRLDLRSLIIKDSKLCQLEQIKLKQKRQQIMNDYDSAWHEALLRDYMQKTEREETIAKQRWHKGNQIQDFLKLQMADKREQRLKVYEEINEEKMHFSQICKEELQKKQIRLRYEQNVRKSIADAITHQINDNYQQKKKQLECELKYDQLINAQVHLQLEKKLEAEKAEKEQFRRDVDELKMARQYYKDVEKAKDIGNKAFEDEWNQKWIRFGADEREEINKLARLGQLEQIKRSERLMKEEVKKEREDNFNFNEREMLERQKNKEARWQQRLKAFRYGRDLLEQKREEELRNLAEKQKLNERLMLADQEREKCGTMGCAFVNSYQDVLPLHPNLLIIKKGKHK